MRQILLVALNFHRPCDHVAGGAAFSARHNRADSKGLLRKRQRRRICIHAVVVAVDNGYLQRIRGIVIKLRHEHIAAAFLAPVHIAVPPQHIAIRKGLIGALRIHDPFGLFKQIARDGLKHDRRHRNRLIDKIFFNICHSKAICLARGIRLKTDAERIAADDQGSARKPVLRIPVRLIAILIVNRDIVAVINHRILAESHKQRARIRAASIMPRLIHVRRIRMRRPGVRIHRIDSKSNPMRLAVGLRIAARLAADSEPVNAQKRIVRDLPDRRRNIHRLDRRARESPLADFLRALGQRHMLYARSIQERLFPNHTQTGRQRQRTRLLLSQCARAHHKHQQHQQGRAGSYDCFHHAVPHSSQLYSL